MARLRLCAVVLAALLLGAAHAERIEDASEEDDAGLGYIVTLNDDDADAEDLCAALAADTDDFNTGGAAHPLDFTAEFPLLRRYEQVACARRVQGICRRVFRRGALGINGMVVDALSRGRIRALARCLPNAVVEPDLPVTAQALDSGNRVPWNLDRLDQAFLPLDGIAGLYTAANGGGDGVHAYVIDSGVRATHREFTVQSSDPNDIKYGWDKTSRVERVNLFLIIVWAISLMSCFVHRAWTSSSVPIEATCHSRTAIATDTARTSPRRSRGPTSASRPWPPSTPRACWTAGATGEPAT